MPRQPPLCTPFSDPSLWCIYLYHKGSDGCVCPTYHIPPVGISARSCAPLSFPHFCPACRDSVLIDFPWKISHNSNFSACTKKTPSPPCFLHFAFYISLFTFRFLHFCYGYCSSAPVPSRRKNTPFPLRTNARNWTLSSFILQIFPLLWYITKGTFFIFFLTQPSP